MELFCCSAAPVQIPSILWEIEHPMYVWGADVSCCITSFDEEEQDTGEVEFYMPPAMAHWHN
eukprot:12899013-Prorocentrum_lima.AAC.1